MANREEELPPSKGGAGGRSDDRKLELSQLKSNLTCALCSGYLIDATTITECMHTFCKSCLLQRLEHVTSCPTCGVQLQRSRLAQQLRLDHAIQLMVYTAVPGLWHEEQRRRKHFVDNHPLTTSVAPQLQQPEYFAPTDPVSLSLDMMPPTSAPQTSAPPSSSSSWSYFADVGRRYFRCPAAVAVHHFQKLLHLKLQLDSHWAVEIYCQGDRIESKLRLMDIAYHTRWTQDEPLRLEYKVVRRLAPAPCKSSSSSSASSSSSISSTSSSNCSILRAIRRHTSAAAKASTPPTSHSAPPPPPPPPPAATSNERVAPGGEKELPTSSPHQPPAPTPTNSWPAAVGGRVRRKKKNKLKSKRHKRRAVEQADGSAPPPSLATLQPSADIAAVRVPPRRSSPPPLLPISQVSMTGVGGVEQRCDDDSPPPPLLTPRSSLVDADDEDELGGGPEEALIQVNCRDDGRDSGMAKSTDNSCESDSSEHGGALDLSSKSSRSAPAPPPPPVPPATPPPPLLQPAVPTTPPAPLTPSSSSSSSSMSPPEPPPPTPRSVLHSITDSLALRHIRPATAPTHRSFFSPLRRTCSNGPSASMASMAPQAVHKIGQPQAVTQRFIAAMHQFAAAAAAAAATTAAPNHHHHVAAAAAAAAAAGSPKSSPYNYVIRHPKI